MVDRGVTVTAPPVELEVPPGDERTPQSNARTSVRTDPGPHAHRHRMRQVVGDWAPLMPFLLMAGGLLVGSAGWLVISSLKGVDGGWTVQAWRDIFSPGLNRGAILRSVRLSAVVATLAAVVGTPLAWYVAHLSRRGRSTAMAVMNVAANFGGASLAIAFVATLGTVGFLRLLLADWFAYDLPLDLYGFWGFVLVYLYFIVPLFVLLVLPALTAVRPEWWEAAQASAATRMQFWRHVGVPVISPFVLAGWVLTFAWSIGQFSVPFALSGDAGGGSLMTLRLGNFLFSATGGTNRFQRAAAMSVLLIAISTVALLGYRSLSHRSLRRLRGGAA